MIGNWRQNRDESLWIESIRWLLLIDSFISPWEKLSCILESAKEIFERLNEQQASSKEQAASGADQLVPIWVLILIRANPRHLQSNINFIQKYADRKRDLTGEMDYYFTTFKAVVNHLKEIRASSLNIDPKEFDLLINSNEPIKRERKRSIKQNRSTNEQRTNEQRTKAGESPTKHNQIDLDQLKQSHFLECSVEQIQTTDQIKELLMDFQRLTKQLLDQSKEHQ